MVESLDPLIAKYGTAKRGHAHFAPSAAAGWLNCPGFLLANAASPDTAGVDAAYGTVAHAIAQDWQQTGMKPIGRLGTVQEVGQFRIPIDADMFGFVEQYIDWCREVDGDHFVEQRLDLSAFMPIPSQYGTADHFACSPGLLVITDLKMGTGVKVFVEDNPQAMLYALGAFEEWDWVYGFQRIIIRICQPRLDYFGVWETSRDNLIEFGHYVRERARLAWSESAPRIPSEKACRWCSAKTYCPAVSLHLENLADDSFDPTDDLYYSVNQMDDHAHADVSKPPAIPGDPRALPTAMLSYRLRYRKLYEKWFNAVYEELLTRAESGEDIPGWKIVAGRRSYSWRNVDDAVEGLIDMGMNDGEIYKSEVISVATAKTAMKKLGMKPAEIEDLMAEFVSVKPGRRALAPTVDDRADAQDEIDEAFTAEGEP